MATPTQGDLPLTLAPQIASYSLQAPDHPEIEIAQASHRIRLVNAWGGAVKRGSRVLELGCGQGTATTVLAEAVGPSGHVDAVDPGAPDYGAPATLAQAQAHISGSAVGPRITWHRATPTDFLARTGSGSGASSWDVVVLAHCIWYFASERELADILAALRGRAGRVCVAEYALRATEPAAFPHVLAVLARGALESQKEESDENVRSPLSPAAIEEIADRSGWARGAESFVVPEPGLLDGSWEVGSVLGAAFSRDVHEAVSNERMRTVVASAREATAAAVRALDGARVRTMDVWVATFDPRRE